MDPFRTNSFGTYYEALLNQPQWVQRIRNAIDEGHLKKSKKVVKFREFWSINNNENDIMGWFWRAVLGWFIAPEFEYTITSLSSIFFENSKKRNNGLALEGSVGLVYRSRV